MKKEIIFGKQYLYFLYYLSFAKDYLYYFYIYMVGYKGFLIFIVTDQYCINIKHIS